MLATFRTLFEPIFGIYYHKQLQRNSYRTCICPSIHQVYPPAPSLKQLRRVIISIRCTRLPFIYHPTAHSLCLVESPALCIAVKMDMLSNESAFMRLKFMFSKRLTIKEGSAHTMHPCIKTYTYTITATTTMYYGSLVF